MPIDRKVLYTVSVSSLAVLLLAFFLPSETSGRILAALLLIPITVITCLFIKKRSILSINKRQITFLMSVMGVLYLMLYYLTGISFGFRRNLFKLNADTFLYYILPITAIIVMTEILRMVMRAQNSKAADILSYATCVAAEALVCSAMNGLFTFSRFMDFMGMALLPAIVSNLLYHYLSKRYGMYPNVVYRLLITLYAYVIPIIPKMSDSLFAFANLFVPLLIYFFFSTLYERKRRYALEKKNRLDVVLTVLAVAIMTSIIMLVSNQFRFGALVIATESMTGELNKGDAVIFERYDDQLVIVGQVIVFERSDSMVVHRVVDIKNINGVLQYYTKGDANDDNDMGFVTAGEIVGVAEWKLPYVGYPTLWLRGLFAR